MRYFFLVLILLACSCSAMAQSKSLNNDDVAGAKRASANEAKSSVDEELNRKLTTLTILKKPFNRDGKEGVTVGILSKSIGSIQLDRQSVTSGPTFDFVASNGASRVVFSVDKKGITEMLATVNKISTQPAKASETITWRDPAGNSCLFFTHAGKKSCDIQFSDKNSIYIISLPLKESEIPDLKQLIQAVYR